MLFYGNAHYLHNNYMEMLACGGIVGFLIHYWIYVYLLRVYIKNFKHHEKEFNICFVLLIFKLIMDIGAVSYYSKTTYFYLLLFIMGVTKIKEISGNRQGNNAVIYTYKDIKEVQGHAY